MAYQTFKGRVWLPERIVSNDVSPLLSLTLDAASESAGFVVKAPRTGTIDRVIYSLMTVSVTSGPLNFDARLETVNAATGLPTGTLLGTDSNGTDAIADTDDNDQREITLTTGVAVTVGDVFAFLLVAPGSGTFNVQLATLGGDVAIDDPYGVSNGAKTNRGPVLGFRYSDGEYWAPPSSWPVEVFATPAVNTGTTPDEVGNRFTFPMPIRINAVSIWMDPAASTSFTLKVIDSGGSTLYTKAIDGDINFNQDDGVIEVPISDLDFDANEMFRVTCTPDGATSMDFHYFDVESASYMDMFSGGQNVHATHRTDAGAWTDTTTRRYMISVGVCAFDDGAGAGGGGTVGRGLIDGLLVRA